MSAINHHQRFTRAEDREIARRRMGGAHWRHIGSALGRTPNSVRVRYYFLREWLEDAHGDVLERNRAEELRLLDRLLGVDQ